MPNHHATNHHKADHHIVFTLIVFCPNLIDYKNFVFALVLARFARSHKTFKKSMCGTQLHTIVYFAWWIVAWNSIKLLCSGDLSYGKLVKWVIDAFPCTWSLRFKPTPLKAHCFWKEASGVRVLFALNLRVISLLILTSEPTILTSQQYRRL